MRILLVHNRYIQRGGEDAVYDAEASLLRERGHQIIEFIKDNRDIDPHAQLALAANTVWSRQSRRELLETIDRNDPDVMHVHNTLPIISPSAYYAAAKLGVPVIQTLHNYRPLCLPGLMSRNGKVCEDCRKSRFYGPGIRHGCYRNDRLASAALAAAFTYHRLIGTWANRVDRFIALTEFARRKFIEGGLPADRIVVKSNFVFEGKHDQNQTVGRNRNGALFVGRLSREKGVLTLVEAFRCLSVHLKIIGDGPLMDTLRNRAPTNTQFVGEKVSEDVLRAMDNASYLVMPSESYEGFALVLVEAFSRGLPVIASRLGAMTEIVENGVTGIHFIPNDAADLASKIRWAEAHPEEMLRMGINARREYEKKYTPEANYLQLLSIYKEVVSKYQSSRARRYRLKDAV